MYVLIGIAAMVFNSSTFIHISFFNAVNITCYFEGSLLHFSWQFHA